MAGKDEAERMKATCAIHRVAQNVQAQRAIPMDSSLPKCERASRMFSSIAAGSATDGAVQSMKPRAAEREAGTHGFRLAQ